MERAARSAERLDDLAAEMRNGFERADRDMRDLRLELKGEIKSCARSSSALAAD
jgi:hypothetical protein